MNLKIAIVGVILCTVIAGCNKSEPSPEIVSEADRILLEQLKQKAMEKQQLLADPDSKIESGKWDKFDKGIINDYTQATGCIFTNTSNFAVTGISGQVTILSSNQAVIGVVPFSAEGVLLPGESKNLKVKSGELSGNGTRAKFDIRSVKIIGD